jgi:hypothetical protein
MRSQETNRIVQPHTHNFGEYGDDTTYDEEGHKDIRRSRCTSGTQGS